jgi:hypothetical protein
MREKILERRGREGDAENAKKKIQNWLFFSAASAKFLRLLRSGCAQL